MMACDDRSRFTASYLLLLAIVVSSSGCGPKNEDFIPPPNVAEQALVKVLDAWKAGLPAGEIPNTKPLVFGTDTSRKPEQKLESYQILGETPGSAGRTFMVHLHLSNPAEELKLQYIVVGIDPLWVFREEDYQLLMHWDHYMPPATQPPNSQSTSAAASSQSTTTQPAPVRP